MKKQVILIFGFILFTGTIYSQGLNKKIDSVDFKKIDSVKTRLENSIKFLNLLDSNKEAKQEYLLSLRHDEKIRKASIIAAKGLAGFTILTAVSLNQENESLAMASFVGGLAAFFVYDITIVIHSIQSKKHLKKAYKLVGLNPPKYKD